MSGSLYLLSYSLYLRTQGLHLNIMVMSHICYYYINPHYQNFKFKRFIDYSPPPPAGCFATHLRVHYGPSAVRNAPPRGQIQIYGYSRLFYIQQLLSVYPSILFFFKIYFVASLCFIPIDKPATFNMLYVGLRLSRYNCSQLVHQVNSTLIFII